MARRPRQARPLQRSVVGGLLLATLFFATLLPAQDGFYLNRLRDGAAAHTRGDFAEAARYLEIAAFGLLEQPPLLANALALLALVQHAQGNAAGYRATFERMVEIEERFGAYSAAELEEGIRREFEGTLMAQLPSEIINASPTFAGIVASQRQAQEAARLASMTEREQAAWLEDVVASQPDNLTARLQLAELRFRSESYPAVVELAGAILEVEPESRRARCLLAASLANSRENCASALEELNQCDDLGSDLAASRGHLKCQVALERWVDAGAFLDALAPQVRSDASIAKLARTIDKKRTRLERAAAKEARSAAALAVPSTDAAPTPGQAQEASDATADLEDSTARPDDLTARLQLVELRYRSGRFSAVVELAGEVLEVEPENERARCLLAASLANSRENCAWSLEELNQCKDLASDLAASRGHLKCQVALERWVDAGAFLDALAPQVRSDASIAKLARTIDKKRTRLERAAAKEARLAAALAVPSTDAAQTSGEAQETGHATADLEDSSAEQPSARNEASGSLDATTSGGDPRQPGSPNSGRSDSTEREGPKGPLGEVLVRLDTNNRENLLAAWHVLRSSTSIAALDGSLSLVREVLEDYPKEREVLFLAGEIAYRGARWATALSYFRQAGTPEPERPSLLFYYAVSAWEAGYSKAAAELLRMCLPQLPSSELVETYRREILGS